jgi:hypothetical protein
VASRIERYLAALGRALRVAPALKERILGEVASHLREGIEREAAQGVPPAEAARRVMARFGEPEVVAAWWAEVYAEEAGGGNMRQRFTERARGIVFFAQEEAARLGTHQVSTSHLLLGLVRDNDSLAVRLLDHLQVARGRIRAGIERRVTRGHERVSRDTKMELTPRLREAIDLAYEEARALDKEVIGSEHLLLGLLRQAEGLHQAEQAVPITGQGILEILPEGWGFLRRFSDFAPAPNDIYVSQGQIEGFRLKTGDWVSGRVRPPGEGERYYGLVRVDSVNGQMPDLAAASGEEAAGGVLLTLGINRQQVRTALASLPSEG